MKNTNAIFHISLLYNLILHHETRRPWWTRIQPHLILGALPIREKNHFEKLVKEEGIQAIITMTQRKELLPNWLGTPITPEEWAVAGIIQCFGSTNDFAPPLLSVIDTCVAFLDEQIQQGKTTYVHCKAGRGRSTVIVLAYLMKHQDMTLDQAYDYVRQRRPHISLHSKQRHILVQYLKLIKTPRQTIENIC